MSSTSGPAFATTPAIRYTHAIPCLSYERAHDAIGWLVDVFGAEARHVYEGPGDTVAHAELWFGDACVMCGSLSDRGFPPTVPGESSIYVVVSSAEAVDALHARAVTAGARIAYGPRDTDYGSHDFGCLDLEGNFWGFGTYAPAGQTQGG
jgi:uncharacterized glyoxalase superfamily protein PhnB